MARIRSIHPGLFTDEAFVSCDPLARLLLLGIWTESDDHGVFEWKPVTLKMRLLALDNGDITDLMGELTAHQIVKEVKIDGKPYGLVRNFCRYQRPKKPTYRVQLPKEFWTYVGLDASGKHPDHSRNPHQSPTTSPPPPGKPVKPARMKEEGGRRKEEGDSKNHIDKPVVVVVPREPETPAGTTTTTQAENDLARQGEPAKAPVSPLGTALPETWVPDQACLTVAFEHGMGELDIEPEVLRFHALNAQRGTFSQNWSRTWTLWCAEFKRRAAKDTAKAPPRVEVSAGYNLTLEQWHAAARRWATTQQWSGQLGPDPESPACRCPKDILAAHNIDPATGIVRKPAPTENA